MRKGRAGNPARTFNSSAPHEKRERDDELESSGEESERSDDGEEAEYSVDSQGDDGELEFQIERLLEDRVTAKGEVEYLVSWLGYPESDNTWETESDLLEDGHGETVEAYNRKDFEDDGNEGELNSSMSQSSSNKSHLFIVAMLTILSVQVGQFSLVYYYQEDLRSIVATRDVASSNEKLIILLITISYCFYKLNIWTTMFLVENILGCFKRQNLRSIPRQAEDSPLRSFLAFAFNSVVVYGYVYFFTRQYEEETPGLVHVVIVGTGFLFFVLSLYSQTSRTLEGLF